MLPIKIYIDAVLQQTNINGISMFVVHMGDMERGDIFVKTESDTTAYAIHHRAYDFIEDSYVWHSKIYTTEQDADTALNRHHAQDPDCWCIDIYSPHNYFKDIL